MTFPCTTTKFWRNSTSKERAVFALWQLCDAPWSRATSVAAGQFHPDRGLPPDRTHNVFEPYSAARSYWKFVIFVFSSIGPLGHSLGVRWWSSARTTHTALYNDEYAYCTPIPKHTLKYTKVKVLPTQDNHIQLSSLAELLYYPIKGLADANG